MTMNTTNRSAAPYDPDPVAVCADHLYAAECALHAARESHVDAWIAAAGDKLHQAVTEHLAALAEQTRPGPATNVGTTSCVDRMRRRAFRS
jgi:hypothetical protein